MIRSCASIARCTKKREKEFQPHKTVASKKKAKVDTTTKDEDDSLREESTANASSVVEEKNLQDVIDLEKLYGFMEQNKNAATKLAGKDLMLLIGYTGAGMMIIIPFVSSISFPHYYSLFFCLQARLLRPSTLLGLSLSLTRIRMTTLKSVSLMG